MQIKKRTLYIVCPIFIIVLIVVYIGYSKYEKKKAEERDRIEFKATFDREVEREYKSLLIEYRSIVETIQDYEYSYDFRFKYVMKLNELLDIRQYENTSFTYSTVNKCIEKQRECEEADKKILKQKAYGIVYAKFMGLDEWIKKARFPISPFY